MHFRRSFSPVAFGAQAIPHLNRPALFDVVPCLKPTKVGRPWIGQTGFDVVYNEVMADFSVTADEVSKTT
jgi:hypothetical protein